VLSLFASRLIASFIGVAIVSASCQSGELHCLSGDCTMETHSTPEVVMLCPWVLNSADATGDQAVDDQPAAPAPHRSQPLSRL